MVYVFSCIKEIKTMRLNGTKIVSEIEREIYSVRFVGAVCDIGGDSTKMIIKISDDGETIEAVVYPRLSKNVTKMLRKIEKGDRAIFFAHLEPVNKICYIDAIRKIDKKDEIRFLAGLFLSYFKIAFKNE
ncbi:MAG: hypothetical protein Q6363_006075 [Candidatus Njordarchaeota archaeon]